MRALPEPLPITAGRIHFIRQVEPESTIRLLNETWRVGKRLAGQYVWATVTTHRHRLQIYHRRTATRPVQLVRQSAYPLSEPEVSVSAPQSVNDVVSPQMPVWLPKPVSDVMNHDK
jgi:hypothetical protein